jgi:hypothetical protein
MLISKNLYLIAFSVVLCSTCNSCEHKASGNDESGTHSNHTMTTTNVSGYADSVNSGLIAKDTMKSSPARTAMATIGETHLHISYHSPGVKGRVIWGGLVSFNTLWVTGAHTATNIQISKPITINNKQVDAGTYAIFTIPGENEWLFILNKNYQQHLTDNYSEKEDVIRLPIVPVENRMTPRLTYTVQKNDEASGSISMEWEKLKIVVPFKTIQ